jgi:hypothetical protein
MRKWKRRSFTDGLKADAARLCKVGGQSTRLAHARSVHADHLALRTASSSPRAMDQPPQSYYASF